MENGIKVKVYSLNNGYSEYDNLKLVRITSKEYNLAIMEDYLPIIGEVDGDILLKGDNFEKKLFGINGYYRCAHNEFELIIRKEANERDN